jgi:hypothetical protein
MKHTSMGIIYSYICIFSIFSFPFLGYFPNSLNCTFGLNPNSQLIIIFLFTLLLF